MIKRFLEILAGIALALFGLAMLLLSSSVMEASARKMSPGAFLFKTGIFYVGGLVIMAVGGALITNEFKKKK